ncbi:MAG TPA: hypothetical protein VFQ57_08950 [Sphingomonas sp.]|jgi:hypothetical protein|nr:hypothetical protein [Sphingomonas sp.]
MTIIPQSGYAPPSYPKPQFDSVRAAAQAKDAAAADPRATKPARQAEDPFGPPVIVKVSAATVERLIETLTWEEKKAIAAKMTKTLGEP